MDGGRSWIYHFWMTMIFFQFLSRLLPHQSNCLVGSSQCQSQIVNELDWTSVIKLLLIYIFTETLVNNPSARLYENVVRHDVVFVWGPFLAIWQNVFYTKRNKSSNNDDVFPTTLKAAWQSVGRQAIDESSWMMILFTSTIMEQVLRRWRSSTHTRFLYYY